MPTEIELYNASQSPSQRAICEALFDTFQKTLLGVESKVWHRAPVWFVDGNPIVGYFVRKGYVQLLFWSGQSFGEAGLKPEGKFKAAEVRLTEVAQINTVDLVRWLDKARAMQWDYKNIVKRRGVLVKIGDW
jgi:hypothetical protein